MELIPSSSEYPDVKTLSNKNIDKIPYLAYFINGFIRRIPLKNQKEANVYE